MELATIRPHFSVSQHNNDDDNDNNNNNNTPETRKYWVDVERGIISSHGKRDPL